MERRRIASISTCWIIVLLWISQAFAKEKFCIGTSKEINFGPRTIYRMSSADGNRLVLQAAGGWATYDIKQGKFRRISADASEGLSKISSDGRTGIRLGMYHLETVDLDSGKPIAAFSPAKQYRDAFVSSGGRNLVLLDRDGRLEVYVLREILFQGKLRKQYSKVRTLAENVREVRQTAQGYVAAVNEEIILLGEDGQRKSSWSILGLGEGPISLSAGGGWIRISDDKHTSFIDPDGKLHENTEGALNFRGEEIRYVQVSDLSGHMFLAPYRAENLIASTQCLNGRVTHRMALLDRILCVGMSDDGQSIKIVDGCQRSFPAIQIDPSPECTDGRSGSKAKEDDTERSDLAIACGQDYDPRLWEGLAPKDPLRMTEAEAVALLHRLQKPGSFVLEKDFPALVAIVEGDIGQRHRDLVSGAIFNIRHDNFELAKLIVRQARGPSFFNGPYFGKCLSPAEKKKIVASFETQMVVWYYGAGRQPNMEETRRVFQPLVQSFSEFPKAKKEELIHQLTTIFVGDAISGRYKGIFPSALYYFIRPGVARMFGEKTKDASYVYVVSNPGPASGDPVLHQLALLSTSAIDVGNGAKGEITPFEFHIHRLPISVRPGDRPQDIHLEWKSHGRNYIFDSAFKVLDVSDKVPPISAPKYDEFWKNGDFETVVVAGSNFKDVGVLDQYLQYYLDKGFRFGSAEDVVDTRAFLKERISSGKTDMFVKEAHADGDDYNVFRLDNRSKIMKGTKRLSDGRTETVYLVSPASASRADSRLLSNEEFGEWIRARESRGEGQILFWNKSCWSHHKAIPEITSARSKALLDIPAITMGYSFTNVPGRAPYAFLDGIRSQKPFAQIREAMKQDPKYAAKSGNWWIFPDEPEYDEKVRKHLRTAVEEKDRRMQRDGKPFVIDEGH